MDMDGAKGKAPPQTDLQQDITAGKSEIGFLLAFHDHLVRVKKPNITVYQPRVFNFYKSPIQNREKPTNLLVGVGGSPTNAWCN